MHFMGPDQRHGFEERPIGEFVARHPGAPFKGGPRWTHFSGQTSGQDRVAIETVGVGYTHYHWFDERVGEAACAWLRERARDERDTRPFAAAVGFVLPHCPFIAPRDLYEKYYDKVDIPEVEEAHPPTMSRYRSIRRLSNPHPELTAEQVRRARAAYFALVELFDGHIGRILSALDDTGLAENTLVVYTSDHGELAGEHGCWTKSCYYEGSVGVPLIARLPGAIAPGSVSGAVCNLMDIGPTLADAAGAPFEHDTDGRSLWPTMTGHHQADWADETTSEFVDIRHRRLPSRMIRSGPWKLWAFGDEDNLPRALYNLEEDPGEMHDRIDDPSYTEIKEELLRKVHEGWDPARAARESEAQEADRAVIDAWGRAVLPDHEDTLPVPPPEIEAGVEIF
jgi:choline-sulfatase